MKWAKKIMGCVSEYIDQRGKSMATGGNYITAAQARVQLEQAKLQNQYAQQQYNQQLQLANAAGNGTFGQYAAQQTQPVKKTFGTMQGGLLVPTFEELEDPDSAFNLPLEALATMWGARFGYRWVKDEDTAAALEENTSMWLTVLKRLADAGRIEVQQFRHPAQLGYDTAWKLIEKDHGNR